MSGIIVIGAQWGDEGKGKIIDVLSASANYVVRFQGGSNAGHTLNINGQEQVLHLIPSGVFHSNTTCLIGPGTALDIENLFLEIQEIKACGDYLKDPSKLQISDSATLLLPYHKLLDQFRESNTGDKIGTTGKGIGPAYEDRASRKALLFKDLFADIKILKKKLKNALEEKNFLIANLYKKKPLSEEKLLDRLLFLREHFQHYICQDISAVICTALEQDKKVLFEGAQGSLLDILHGTYPYVTSSSTIAGSAIAGIGVHLQRIKKIIVISKAYTTRVGEGPFPTQCKEEEGKILQQKGKEWGATTGRKRRCGWLDLPALQYAIRINGATHLALTKLDTLSYLKEIPICISYKLQNKKTTNYLNYISQIEKGTAVYKNFPGWQTDISSIRQFKDLPQPAQDYILFIEDYLKIPIEIISVGPSREDTIFRKI